MSNDYSKLSAESAIDSLAKIAPEEVYAAQCDEVFSAIARHNEGLQNVQNMRGILVDDIRREIEADFDRPLGGKWNVTN